MCMNILIFFKIFTEFQHVNKFFIRLSVHRETGGSRYRNDLGPNVARVNPW